MPLFSVIIPVYNRRELLQEALASVWAQTFKDFEVIIVDDGSTDGTWEYMQTLGPAITALRQENAGPGAARNKGVEAARGDYIAFLDSDDLWFSWTLDTLRKAFAVAPEVSLVSGKQGDVEIPPVEAMAVKFAYFPCLFASDIRGMFPIGGTPSVAVRKKVFKQVGGFCPDRINAEDVDLWMRLGVVPGFVQILFPPLYLNRVHETNVSRDSARNESGLDMMLRQEQAGAYPGGRQYRDQRLNVITAMFRSASGNFLSLNNVRAAWRLYLKSFAYQFGQRRYLYISGFPLFCVWTICSNFVERLRHG